MKKRTQFSGKKIIITGSASGIGYALANGFAESGASVVLFDINKEKLEQSASTLSDTHQVKIYSKTVDVADFKAFKQSVDEVVDTLGPVDIFINNAGVGIVGEFSLNSAEEIDQITSINYLGMVYGSKIILEHFYNQGYGHLVNVASVAGLQGFPKMSLYCGAKFGIVGFSQSIRFELERKGIDISVALPSSTDTPMIIDRLDDHDDVVPGVLMAIPMCKTENVADAILKGIAKRKFMIFPTFQDKGTLFMHNYMPRLMDHFIRRVGFQSFTKKREKLIKAYR